MKILIVDDHAVVRYGLKLAFESHGHQVVATAGSVKQAQAFLTHTNPDAIVVDINLPDGSGLELVSWSRKVSPTIAIVVLTLNDGADYVRAAQQAGANSYIVKDAPLTEVLAALDFAITSPGSFSSKTAFLYENDLGLTAREIDVLHLVNLGLSNSAIAHDLFISLSTVKSHVSAILQKLDADNRVKALSKARERGLIL